MTRTCPPQQAKRFYWFIVLPIQSLCLTPIAAPLYGFNALVRPINEVFSQDNINNGWAGALIGGTLFLSLGFGGLTHNRFLKLAGNRTKLFVAMNAALVLSFVIAAIACHYRLYWLLMFGFAVPAGVSIVNLFFIGLVFLVSWGHAMGKVGLSSGTFGMLLGFWGAVYSVLSPIVRSHVGFLWMLILLGFAVAAVELLGLLLMIDPPESTTEKTSSEKDDTPILAFRNIVQFPSFWVFGFFILLFLLPGFGFKLIVSALSDEVFHTTESVASSMAAIFLVCYGASRLGFGILSDSLPIKPMYFIFSLVQAVALLIAAVSLPYMKGVVFFTFLMCLTGTMFAAGKCLWSVTMVRMFGQKNFHTPMMLTQPFVGIAAFLGPVSLTWALRAEDVRTSVGWWLYASSGALAVATFLFQILRRFNYERFAKHQRQGLNFHWRSKDEFDRF
ncbi:MAG: hypothetical protein P8N76_07965 [Pirellulaceae bacterium]|nr:hypothetical protein [Pirellulaceae bacterium]